MPEYKAIITGESYDISYEEASRLWEADFTTSKGVHCGWNYQEKSPYWYYASDTVDWRDVQFIIGHEIVPNNGQGEW